MTMAADTDDSKQSPLTQFLDDGDNKQSAEIDDGNEEIDGRIHNGPRHDIPNGTVAQVLYYANPDTDLDQLGGWAHRVVNEVGDE